jgi:nucleoside-diphosphate-sugar epimerase
MTSGPTVAIAAAVLGIRYRIAFGGSTVFQYAEDVARTLILASRSGLVGANVFNLGGSAVPIADWIQAIEEEVPEAAGLISHQPSPLPFPAEIDHAGLAILGEIPVTPYRMAIAATVERFRTVAAAGRLVAAEQGIASTA